MGMRMPRTKEAMIFEAANILLLTVMWIIIARNMCVADSQTVLLCGADGRQPGHVDTTELLIIGIVATCCSLLFTVGAYFPAWYVNIPVKVKTPRQHHLTSRMTRTLGLEMGLLFICNVFIICGHGWAKTAIHIAAGVCVLTLVVFCTIIERAR